MCQIGGKSMLFRILTDKSSLRNQAISLINDNQVPIGLVLQTQFILLERG